VALRQGRRLNRGAAIVTLFLSVAACAGTPPANLGAVSGRLAPCPSSPNCVSSDATDVRHAVAAFVLAAPAAEAWRAAGEAVAGLPRTRIVVQTADYLHAECRSAIFGFVDDLELLLHVDDGQIAVRSASRLGYGDMGVNRSRIEQLRDRLVGAGIIDSR